MAFDRFTCINIKIQVYRNSKQAHAILSDNNDILQSVHKIKPVIINATAMKTQPRKAISRTINAFNK